MRDSHQAVPLAAAGAVLGSTAAIYWPDSTYAAEFWWLLLAALGLAAAMLRWRPVWSVALLATVLAAWWSALTVQDRQQSKLEWRERLVQAPVQTLQGHVVGLPESDDRRTRFELSTAGGDHRLRLSWYDSRPRLRPGQCWTLELRLRPAHGAVNAGGFDYEQWLFRRNIVGTGSVRSGKPCGAATGWSLDRLRWDLVRWLDARLATDAGRALIPALLVGDRRGIDDAQWEVLRITGTSHLVAISGLHIGLLAVVGYGLGSWLWRRSAWLCRRLASPRAGALLGLLLAAAYAALSGFALPAQRALLMVAVFVAATWVGRGAQAWHALALAALAVLVLDPLAPLSAGFWLSFGAVAWIILIARRPPATRWLVWPRVQAALSLGLAPATALWFGAISVIGPVVNLQVIPLFAVLVPMLLASAVLTAIAPGALAWALAVMDHAMAGLWWLLHAASRLPGAMHTVDVALLPAVLAVAGVIVLLIAASWRGRLLALALWVPMAMPVPDVRPHVLQVDVLDVGQGLAALLRTRSHTVLVDAGPAYPGGFDAGDAIVVPSLRAMGVQTLDALVISHSDGDHAGGADAVAAAYPPGRWLGAGGEPCMAGQAWTWDAVRFEVLHPEGGPHDDNNASCVLRVALPDGQAVLLPGDIERAGEAALLRSGQSLRADVLLLPHHGSNSSSSSAFLAAVAPDLAIASAGFRNRWGFPDHRVRARLLAQDVPLLSTASSGQIGVALDPGKPVRLASRRDRVRRVWRSPPSPAWISVARGTIIPR